MATVSLPIGGRRYDVTCRAGEEAHLTALAERIDAKVTQATASAGRIDEVRGLLYAALLIADEGPVAPAAPPPSDARPDPAVVAGAIERLAARVERLAEQLEHAAEAP